ncbi:TPA: tRNA lysidine(34) synthetase TilS [Patescibacteria group bacterium]|nr:tRNA lysidine(34) synthetase TilS [Patescibacteria group bacterium]
MELKDKLISELNSQYFPSKGTTLVVAVSGGVDSVVLLHILLLLSAHWDWEIIVAHFDHQLRKTSQRDAEFVQKLAKNLGLDYVSAKTNVSVLAKRERLTIEEAARKARYDFLQQVARRRRALIVTGHTADDQLETVVMNWLRGGGVRALAGMRDLDNNIWRPLLSITKTQIKEFVRQYQLTYREDETNQQTKFKRNLIRHKVMPTLRLVNPSLEQVLLRNAKVMASLADFVGQETARLYKKMAKSQKDAIWLDLKKLNQLPEFLRNEVILFTIRQLQGHQQDIKKIHLDEVQKIINSAEGKAWKQLPGQLFVSNRYGKIGFSRYRPKFLNR